MSNDKNVDLLYCSRGERYFEWLLQGGVWFSESYFFLSLTLRQNPQHVIFLRAGSLWQILIAIWTTICLIVHHLQR